MVTSVVLVAIVIGEWWLRRRHKHKLDATAAAAAAAADATTSATAPANPAGSGTGGSDEAVELQLGPLLMPDGSLSLESREMLVVPSELTSARCLIMRLRSLNLSRNNIKELPASIGRLTEVTLLW